MYNYLNDSKRVQLLIKGSCMKILLRFLFVIATTILLAACQSAPVATPELSTPVNTPELTLQVTEAEDMPAAIEPDSTGPIVQFNESADSSDFFPQVWLYSDPFDDSPMSVKITCDGKESEIWTPLEGVLINNHCIINNYHTAAYVVLPDGSLIGMAENSRIQVNMANETSEVILEAGEIYNVVAPQGVNRRFTVLVGGVGIEAQGTRYGVSLKDKLIQVVVFDGKVFTHRCLNWAIYTCMKWDQVSVEYLPGYEYSNTVGELDWTKGNQYNPDNMQPDPTLPVSGHLEPILGNTMTYKDGFENGIYWDLENVDTTRLSIQEHVASQLTDSESFNRIAGEMNLSSSNFCALWFDSCPLATPIPSDNNPFGPVNDGGGGDQSTSSGGAKCSGCPHQFDLSSCFTQGGHTWCFPVAGSVDPSMSAEWDVTALCNSYPGEAICSQIR